MYTADDIRKMQASMGLTITGARSESNEKYTAEDVVKIQRQNAEKGRDLLRTEGRTPGTVQTETTQSALSAYDRALEQYREDRISDPMKELARRNGEKVTATQEGPGFASDKFDRWITETGQKMDQNYNTVTQWYGEAGTEQNERRHTLVQALEQADKEIAREVWNGNLEQTGTIQAMANQRLAELGYSRGEISVARQMMDLEDEMGIYDEGRRVGQTVRGTALNIASAIPQTIETAKQGLKNTEARQALSRGDEARALSVAVDAVINLDRAPEVVQKQWQSQGIYNLDDLIQKNKEGWTEEEILSMAAALEGAAAPVSQDTLGYQMYQTGQAALEDAMRGESEGQRFLHSAATSAGENVALAAINPALVLPVMTAQTVADSLGEATASGQTPGHALASAGLKAGIGWIIEEAGVAQMAQNMGRKFAASALSEKILNFIHSAPGMEALQQGAPVLYGVVASGADEAVEEFVESYADKLVDVALGDAQASELLSLEQLAEAGMGAAGGALGGAMIGGASTGIGMLAGARDADRAGSPAPVELAPEAPAAQMQQEAQVSQTQTPASAVLSQKLDAVQAAVAPTAAPATGATAAAQQATAEPQQAAQAQQTAPVQNQEWETPPSVGQDGQLGMDAWEQLAARQAARRAQQEAANSDVILTEQSQGRESVDVVPAASEAQKAREVTEAPYWTREQRQEARLLAENSSMTPEAVELVVDAMPQDISGEVYTPAARMIYQIARQGLAETETDALTLAGKSGAMVPQVLAVAGGAEALHQVWNQGRIEGLEASGYGRAGMAPAETAGTMTMEEGVFLPEEDKTLLDLSAAASDTAVTVREKLENNAGGYINTALGQIYFAAEEGQDTFGTVLHEQTHLYNALDPEGGRTLQTHLLRELAESRGYEQVDRLIQSYIRRYQEAGQPISYAQACEEVAADAWRGVFGSVESMARWAQRQAAQAEKNAESRGTIRKMVDAVKDILDNVIQRAKQILAKEPENTAARWAMELAEDQKRALEEEYYQHQDAALEAQRNARRDGRAPAANRTAEQAGRKVAQLREGKTAAERTAEERRAEESGQKAKAPQAGWSGKGDAAYDTLTALPDMEITPIDTRAVEGKNYREIVADAFENMGAGRQATKATVTNRYTGMEIAVKRQSIEHSFNAGRQIKSRGPYVERIGSILENAVKVNELEPRSNELRSDIYLGAAKNEKGELVGVRLIVNVYENGRAELDAASLEDETGRLYAHLGTKIGDAEASPMGAPAFEAGGHAVSRSPLQGPRASAAEAEPSHMISIAGLIGAVKETKRIEGRKNVVNWLEGVLSEDVRRRIGSGVTAPTDMADSLRYQLPVDNTPAESGQKAAAWENVDRGELEQEMARAYQEKNVRRVPVENLREMARRLLKDTQSKENQITLAKKLENLAGYLSGGKVDGRTALTMAEDIAESLMRKSGRQSTELWDQYPDLHYHTLYVQRGGTEYKEVVSQYGKFGIAQKELAKYGITLTTGEAHKDSAVDVVYESLSREYPGLFPVEITDPMKQIDTIAEVRDAISIKYQNNYGENWEEAKADLAMQILGGMVREGVTDRTAAGTLIQRIDENLNWHRAEIRERTVRELDLQERRIRRDAYRSAKRIVDEAGKANLARSERDQKKIQELEAAAQRRAEAWAKTKGNLRTALASSRNSLQRARDARSADATRRVIAANVAKLNRMLIRPSEKSHVPEKLLRDALTIAQIGNAVTYNETALLDLQAIEKRLKEYAKDGGADGLATDFEASGILDMMESLTGSLSERRGKNARLEQQADTAARNTERGLDEMRELQGAQEEWRDSTALSENVSKNGAPRLTRLTATEMNTIRDLTSAILTVVQNSNKLLATQTAQKATEFAAAACAEVESSHKRLGENPKGIKKFELKFLEGVLNAERLFGVLGGFRHGGAMEAMAKALAAGEAKKTAVREEGVRRFSDVLDGKENQEKLKKFAGPTAELVDVGLSGGAKVNHAQVVTLWLHFQNEQNARHVLKGGVKIPNMEDYARGDMKEAYRKSTVEHFALDEDIDYAIQVQGIRNRLESVMDDYDWAWIKDLQNFFDEYTKGKINGVSRMLSGYEKAVVEKYFPLAVDPDALQRREIDGLVYNHTVENLGFLKERKEHATQPVLLEECSQAMQRSLEDVAAYVGLAPVIRDFNKIWSAKRDDGGSLFATVGREFGEGATKYVENYISDLQVGPRGRDSIIRTLDKVQGRYAGAVLNLNLKVALGQVSGVFGAGSELGAKHTAAAFEYMMKRMTGQFEKGEDARIRQEMMDWGYWGLEGTLSDGPTAELAELKRRKDAVSRFTEKLPGINALETMDKLTREGIWVGAKGYVAEHFADYGLTEADVETQSDGYRAAVVAKTTETINRTQPNYTASQMAALQRDPDQLAKILTMFKGQGFQNFGVMQYAVEDYRAQRQRMKEAQKAAQREGLSEEKRQQAQQYAKAAEQQAAQAGQRLKMAAAAQATQALVYSIVINAVAALAYHRLDDLRDEDGKITPASVIWKVLLDGAQSATVDNVLFLPEAMAVMGNLFGFRDEDPVSLVGIDALGDIAGDFLAIHKMVTSGEMDFLTAADKCTRLAADVFNLTGLPVSTVKRLVVGAGSWVLDIRKALITEGVNLGDVINTPTSSSQYDELYTAVFETENSEDAADALAALEKLDKLNPPAKPGDAKAGDTKILSELLKREKEFGGLIQDAAAARVNGDAAAQEKAMGQLVDVLAQALGINKNTSEGRRRLTTVINKANSAISDQMRTLMGADSKTGATIYTPVLNALETGGGLAEAQAVLRRAGISDEDIRSAVQSAYKEDYLYSDEASRAVIERKLLSLKDAEGGAYFTEEDLAGWVTDWTLKGFNDGVYTDLDEALRTRNQITAQEEITRYMEAGKSADSIRGRITAVYKDEYLKASAAQRQQLAKFLARLRGPKGEKLVTADTLTGWIRDEAKKRAGR